MAPKESSGAARLGEAAPLAIIYNQWGKRFIRFLTGCAYPEGAEQSGHLPQNREDESPDCEVVP